VAPPSIFPGRHGRSSSDSGKRYGGTRKKRKGRGAGRASGLGRAPANVAGGSAAAGPGAEKEGGENGG